MSAATNCSKRRKKEKISSRNRLSRGPGGASITRLQNCESGTRVLKVNGFISLVKQASFAAMKLNSRSL